MGTIYDCMIAMLIKYVPVVAVRRKMQVNFISLLVITLFINNLY